MIDRALRLTLHRHDQEEQTEGFSAFQGIFGTALFMAGLGVSLVVVLVLWGMRI
jgi:hypothetical protein